MKKVLFCLTLLLLCLDCAWAAELPDSVTDAVPPEAADLLPEMDTSASHETLWQGLGDLWHSACAYVRTALETQASGAALLLVVVLLCSLAESCLAAADRVGSSALENTSSWDMVSTPRPIIRRKSPAATRVMASAPATET